MTRLITDLVDGSNAARTALEEEISRLQASGGAQRLIDELAGAALASPEALETLLGVIQRHRLARAAIRSLIVNESDVDDVEQSVLAVVSLKLDQFRGDSRFTTWLYQVARNEAKMLIRSRSRRPEKVGGDIPETGYLARLSTLVGDRDVIERALASLPDAYREVLILREVDHLGYQEIAERLGLKLGTVRSRLHKARELMARRLGGSPDSSAFQG